MFTRLRNWISREITQPLEVMYLRLDEDMRDDMATARVMPEATPDKNGAYDTTTVEIDKMEIAA